jgi:MerR family mercuric resistance operon transcriptional regulator
MRSVAPQSPAALSIGELSRRSGVNIETIRYYERIKMLPAPPRTASGRRVYGPAETWSLFFIRRSRELGFTLEEIRTLLALSGDDGKNTCTEVRELAASHLADIGQRRTFCPAFSPWRCTEPIDRRTRPWTFRRD